MIWVLEPINPGPGAQNRCRATGRLRVLDADLQSLILDSDAEANHHAFVSALECSELSDYRSIVSVCRVTVPGFLTFATRDAKLGLPKSGCLSFVVAAAVAVVSRLLGTTLPNVLICCLLLPYTFQQPEH